jgi:hypothetical protein
MIGFISTIVACVYRGVICPLPSNALAIRVTSPFSAAERKGQLLDTSKLKLIKIFNSHPTENTISTLK